MTKTKEEQDAPAVAFVTFVVAWAVGGLLGIVPWTWNSTGDWRWQMTYHNAWYVWFLAVTLFAIACAAIAYFAKRWL